MVPYSWRKAYTSMGVASTGGKFHEKSRLISLLACSSSAAAQEAWSANEFRNWSVNRFSIRVVLHSTLYIMIIMIRHTMNKTLRRSWNLRARNFSTLVPVSSRRELSRNLSRVYRRSWNRSRKRPHSSRPKVLGNSNVLQPTAGELLRRSSNFRAFRPASYGSNFLRSTPTRLKLAKPNLHELRHISFRH